MEACYVNHGEIPGNNIDDDKNGYVDDYYGYNFIRDNGELFNDKTKFSHGSFVSSIIGGRKTGGKNDVIGIVPDSRLAVAVVLKPADVVEPWAGEGGMDDIIAVSVMWCQGGPE